ncbi:MAG TPA: MGMT family protein [Candidatus Saccharimonadales bacterium]|nr:MGMT family protein [Candidatus Saccharimonadales bacterium]
MKDPQFKKKVYALVVQIPAGKCMTYGQIAALCGKPRGAWEVGQIAHFGPADLPWQRVVNKQGGLAIGWPHGGREGHRAVLEAEGIKVREDFTIDVASLQWWPHA